MIMKSNWLKRQTGHFTAWKTHFLYGVYFIWLIPVIKYLLTKEVDLDGMIWFVIAFEVGQNSIVNKVGFIKWFKTKFIDSVVDCIVAVIGGCLSLTVIILIVTFIKFLGV